MSGNPKRAADVKIIVLRGLGLALIVCLVPIARAQFIQQGGKLQGAGAVAAQQGWSVALSADGNTAIVGGLSDASGAGAVWIFTRANRVWSQQGSKLAGPAGAQLGSSVAISADGNTAVAGGSSDGNRLGAAWVFTRVNGTWTQQAKLTGSGSIGATPQQGASVAISGDGNTVLAGGPGDNNNAGALWVFTRANTVWTQQAKLAGAGAVGSTGAMFATSVAISADGNTAAAGGIGDSEQLGAVWVFSRVGGVFTQQAKVAGSGALGANGAIVLQGTSVALSSDGNTLIEGGIDDHNFVGAVWAFTRSGSAWSQQGGKLVPTDATISVGTSVSLSGDGNTAVIGAPFSSNATGAFWQFTRTGGIWTQRGIQTVGAGASGAAQQGASIALSADAATVIAGAPADSGNLGAAWIFTQSTATHLSVSAPASASPGAPFNFSVTALDANNNLATGYSGTVRFSSSDSTAVLPVNATLTNGTGTFAATLKTPGPQSITATDTLQPAIAGTSAAISMTLISSAGSAQPAFGSGTSQMFTFTFNDSRGYQDLDVVNVLINNFLDGRNACYLAYTRSLNVLYLVNDAGSGIQPGVTLNGAAGTMANSQCSVNAAASSASGSGNTLTLTVAVTFAGPFAGNKVTYLAARDLEGGNSGWQAAGTWGVTGASTFPAAVGASPPRGAGSSQTFSFTFSDTKGAQDLGIVNVLINNSLDGRQACYLAYSRPTNTLFLVNDAGTALLPGLANSQCSVTTGPSAVINGNTLTLTLTINFTTAFNGDRVIYLAARDATDANNSGWQSLGSWTVQ